MLNDHYFNFLITNYENSGYVIFFHYVEVYVIQIIIVKSYQRYNKSEVLTSFNLFNQTNLLFFDQLIYNIYVI